MKRAAIASILLLAFLAACGGITGDRVTVSGTGPDDMLKLRAGPGLGFRIVLGLPDGTALQRGDCVTEEGQRWCRVSLRDAPGLSGYVAADYLVPR